MADRVVLHIGSMKSGTSFIQNVLGNNREALAEHGITFAGERWRDQVTAVQDLIAHGGPRQEPLDLRAVRHGRASHNTMHLRASPRFRPLFFS